MSKSLKSLILILSLVFTSSQLLADIASLDPNYVVGEADLVTHLNNDRTTLTNAVNNVQGTETGSVQSSGQIKADTIGEENMADEINPRIRTFEGASCEFVASGFNASPNSSSLLLTIPVGVAYPLGYRVETTSSTARTLTASRDTYVDIDINGGFTYSEVANGGAVPTVAVNSIRLFKAVTSTTAISSIQDLRITSCTDASFDSVKAGTAQASLGDMMRFTRFRFGQDIGVVEGAQISYDTVSTFKVRSGFSFFTSNSQYRAVSSDVTVTTGNDDPSTNGSGLDTGAIAANTTYSVYLTADYEDVASYGVTYSTSATAPTGVSNYRRIGEIKTDANSNFTSRDTVTTHRAGKVLQDVYTQSQSYSAFTTTMPFDDTVPTSSEGTELMTISIDPVRAGNDLWIETKGYFQGASTGDRLLGAIYRDSETSALPGCAAVGVGTFAGGAVDSSLVAISCRTTALSAANTTLKFRAGGASALTGYFNGSSANRIFGGSMASYMRVTEEER